MHEDLSPHDQSLNQGLEVEVKLSPDKVHVEQIVISFGDELYSLLPRKQVSLAEALEALKTITRFKVIPLPLAKAEDTMNHTSEDNIAETTQQAKSQERLKDIVIWGTDVEGKPVVDINVNLTNGSRITIDDVPEAYSKLCDILKNLGYDDEEAIVITCYIGAQKEHLKRRIKRLPTGRTPHKVIPAKTIEILVKVHRSLREAKTQSKGRS